MVENIQIKEIDFETVLPIWKERLWPDRKFKIEKTSAIAQDGTIDIQVQNYSVYFFSAVLNDQIVGVISVQQTGQAEYRSRGLWVDENHRSKKIGRALMYFALHFCKEKKALCLWTLARHTAVSFYEKNQFLKLRKIEEYEYGPHFLMVYHF